VHSVFTKGGFSNGLTRNQTATLVNNLTFVQELHCSGS
jgi:hypothetical protein